jgi:hypothetical protein
MKVSWNLLDKLREKYTDEVATQAKEVIKIAAKKARALYDSSHRAAAGLGM